ncbi:hypothetical protein HNR46_001728 [Haloferula luteola]|uniref:Uncharacterized protein n=1 Tax=Haloferula luteola TaxID=595692 RepID=A0A840VFA8_9BACT|nr:hypothetical protein [Haloferula luteola]
MADFASSFVRILFEDLGRGHPDQALKEILGAGAKK